MRPPNKRWLRPLLNWSVTTKLFVVLALVVTLTVGARPNELSCH